MGGGGFLIRVVPCSVFVHAFFLSKASGDEDLYEAAFRKPITRGNQGRWMWQRHGEGENTISRHEGGNGNGRESSRRNANTAGSVDSLTALGLGVAALVAGIAIGFRSTK